MNKLALPLLLALCLAGCQEPATQRGIEATRVSKFVSSAGTTTVMGSMRLPAGIVSNNSGSLVSNNAASFGIAALGSTVPLGQVLVQIVNQKGLALPNVGSVHTDAHGGFELPAVPVGTPMLVQGRLETTRGPVILRKYLRPHEALTCANVDLATTLVADKLTSNDPLVKADPGLAGSDLFELADPARLQEVEDAVRRGLEAPDAPSPEAVLTALAEGQADALFDAIAEQTPEIADAYQETFERPDSSLGLRIAAVGRNQATVPRSEGPVVMGVMQLKISGAPLDTLRIAYHVGGRQVLEAAGPSGEGQLDTWTLPNGPCTLVALAIMPGGRQEVVSRTYMVVRNSLDMHCP